MLARIAYYFFRRRANGGAIPTCVTVSEFCMFNVTCSDFCVYNCSVSDIGACS